MKTVSHSLSLSNRSQKVAEFEVPTGHPKIIHRDIKAANILVDYNFEPKVNTNIGIYKYDIFGDSSG